MKTVETLALNIKRKSHQPQNGNGTVAQTTFNSLAEEQLTELIEDSVTDKGNLYIEGSDVYRLMKNLYKEIIDFNKKGNSIDNIPEFFLFSKLDQYFRFYINVKKDRKYCSERSNFNELGEEEFNKIGNESKLLFENLIGVINHPEHARGRNAVYDLFQIMVFHIYQKLNDNLNECVPVNDYLKSDFRTWNRRLKKDDELNYGSYPFCKLLRLADNESIALIIVTQLDPKYIDSKVKDIDRIEPAHLLIFRSPELYRISDVELKNIGYNLQYRIGQLSYAGQAGRTNETLQITAIEQPLVSRFWYSDGIEHLFPKDKEIKNLTGKELAIEIAEKILCANVKGLRNLEVYPFDRIFIFPGSNYRAAKKNEATGDFELRMTTLEAAIKSKRPQDNQGSLSSMERLEGEVGSAVQPNLDIEFDVTQKEISDDYVQEYNIDRAGYLGNVLVENHDTFKRGRPVMQYQSPDEDTREKAKEWDMAKMITEDLKEPGDDAFEKINAVAATLFVGLLNKERFEKYRKDRSYDSKTDKEIHGLVAKDLQKLCQRTYNDYDKDGLCFISDFGVKIKEIPTLYALQEVYLRTFFYQTQAEWSRVWKDNENNIPDIEKFATWINDTESKVTLVSFDPSQNMANLDKEGNRYLSPETDGFTMIIIQDESKRKNNFDINTEALNFQQLLRMVIRRKLNETRMEKDTIREQKAFFNTIIPSMLHRVKNYLSDQSQKDEVDRMRKEIENVMKNEDFSPETETVSNINAAYKYFFENFIKEQLVIPDDAVNEFMGDYSHMVVLKNLTAACKKYAERKVKDLNLSVSADSLQLLLNENCISKVQLLSKETFVIEAIKILLNNAIEHAMIFAEKEKKPPKVIISFNAIPTLSDEDTSVFELSIINSSYSIPNEKLKNINSSKPKDLEKDPTKASSTGIGLFIARKQLQNTIGKRADIKVLNVGENLVEAKLVLPATIFYYGSVEQNVDAYENSLTQEAEEEHKENYILYIEDNEIHYRNSLTVLNKILGENQDHIFACNNFNDAKKQIEKNWPLLTLMDMTFLNENGGSDINAIHGTRILQKLIANPVKPPIVIISGKDMEELKMILSDIKISKFGYKYKGEIKGKFEFTDGCIYSINAKSLTEENANPLCEAIKKWATGVLANVIREQLAEAREVHIAKSGMEVESVDFFDENFDLKLEAYRQRNILKIRQGFVAYASAKDEIEFWRIISKWLIHSGTIRLFPGEVELKPLYSNEIFTSIFLQISISDSLLNTIDFKLKYWCFTHNILITTIATPVESEVFDKWFQTPHGYSGTISKLRHDLLDKSGIYGQDLEKILEKVNRLEKDFLFFEKSSLLELRATVMTDYKNAITKFQQISEKMLGYPESHYNETIDALRKYENFYNNPGKATPYIERLENFKYLISL